MTTDTMLRVLVAFEHFRTPAKVTRALLNPDPEMLRQIWRDMDIPTRTELGRQSEELTAHGVIAVSADDPRFPRSLVVKERPIAPALFCRGALGLLTAPGAGICGSRSASPLGLEAARTSGQVASDRGLTVISGYAKGVDTESHLAALENGGTTVLVLAEGIDHFRVKRELTPRFDPDRVLVLSQFHPGQPWATHTAMTRNRVIFGLGMALIAIEAGERGGTLAAGREALKRGRPVLVLNFGDDIPGNRLLVDAGAQAVTSRQELGDALASIRSRAANASEQGRLL
ncbi:DNA-processing protein DprA [Nocardia sp. NPDC059764]|uniref:DNA-processing protein DprA n=1 Tax=Nocardia sp. NPDC059764 TaxID=3346939 RepID=UPI0036534858